MCGIASFFDFKKKSTEEDMKKTYAVIKGSKKNSL